MPASLLTSWSKGLINSVGILAPLMGETNVSYELSLFIVKPTVFSRLGLKLEANDSRAGRPTEGSE